MDSIESALEPYADYNMVYKRLVRITTIANIRTILRTARQQSRGFPNL